jgi:uncharacterized protein
MTPPLTTSPNSQLQTCAPTPSRSAAIISATEHFVVKRMGTNEGSHDALHAMRVRNLAVKLASDSPVPVNMLVIELAALTHDLYDRKVWSPAPGAHEDPCALLADDLRTICGLADPATVTLVVSIAQNISFSKQKKRPIPKAQRCVEMDIVQDADRLDSLGAIGLARCFAYGGSISESLGKTRAHFDEKLLRLLPLICTEQGARVARERHAFMLDFVHRFDDELRFASPSPAGEVA